MTASKPTNAPIIHRAQRADAAAAELAELVAQSLREAVAQRGRALLVVSGGSTPLPFFEALSRTELPWEGIWVTLADERWVEPDEIDSNERLVRAHLLAGPASRAHFVPLKNAAATPELGQAEAEAALARLPWPADVMVLGVGADGHTASLFPHARQWPQWLGARTGPRCAAVDAPAAPNVPVPRLSLTPTALLDAQLLVVHATGSTKWAVLQAAMQDGPVDTLPVRWVLIQRRVPCHVFIAP